MKKLDKTFQINPLYEMDGYKVGHNAMLAPNTSREYWTWVPRSLKYMPKGIDKMMSAGQQMVWRYIHSNFKENFFDRSVEEAQRFGRDMCKYLMMDYNADHFINLHKLGYLPVRIKALPEGIFTSPNIPHMTGINTLDGYAWLGLALETLVSKLGWQLPTAATIGHKFKQNAVEWVTKTDPENLWLADYMCHDFHSRGGNPFTSIAVGLGHAMSNNGSDTLNVIPASRYYYDFNEEEVPIYSVNASEHSVTCTGIFYYEELLKSGQLNNKIEEYYSFSDYPSDGSKEKPDYLAIAEWLNLKDWLKKFPKGILSIVSDTFDLWKLIIYILPRLKKEILARDGKLVIRPDSGDPVGIICGELPIGVNEDGDIYSKNSNINTRKGVIELLWDIFGGETTSTGYKRLNSHIGAIYGDSINLERQVQIYERLSNKGFASTNIVLGVGSFTYVMLTRDSGGWAIKGNWFETFYESKCRCKADGIPTNELPTSCKTGCRKSYNIYKDPITDDGTKKSLKGFCMVEDWTGASEMYEGELYTVKQECTSEEESKGILQIIYEDGKFYNQTTLPKIREKNKNM